MQFHVCIEAVARLHRVAIAANCNFILFIILFLFHLDFIQNFIFESNYIKSFQCLIHVGRNKWFVIINDNYFPSSRNNLINKHQ